MKEWKCNWPPNAELAVTTMRSVALGEFIDYSLYTKKVLDFYGIHSKDALPENATASESTDAP